MNIDFKVISLWFSMSNFSIWISSLTPNLKQLSLKNNVQKCISYEKWFIHQNIHLRLIIVYWLVVNHVSKSLWPNRNNWFFFFTCIFLHEKKYKNNIWKYLPSILLPKSGKSWLFSAILSKTFSTSDPLLWPVCRKHLSDSFDNEGK